MKAKIGVGIANGFGVVNDFVSVISEKLEELGIKIDEELEAGLRDLKSGARVVCVASGLGDSVREMGSSPRAHTVMVRVDDLTKRRLDAWVETGAVKSRSEAAALFIREGLQVRMSELNELEEALTKVDEAKRKLREKAKTVFGEASNTDDNDTNSNNEAGETPAS